jgi:Putative amidase domain
MARRGVAVAILTALLIFCPASLAASQNPDGTYSETVGSNANTWTDYTNAGATEGPTIPSGATVEVACVVQGFRVADGNTNWYLIAAAPWNSAFYVSADAFYNNGQTSGSLIGTPFVDPSVPSCTAGVSGVPETTGSEAHTWTDYADAGGSQGPTIGGQAAVIVSCRLTGFTVSDGNSWWYRVASPPWNNNYAVSADAFYNNGQTSGSLIGTPFVDPAVPVCAASSGGGNASGNGGAGSGSGAGGGGSSPVPSPAPRIANAFYNRSAAVAWARQNAEDAQPWADMCTWFASNALWAGGFPQSSAWKPSGDFHYSSYGITHTLPGTPDAWQLLPFLSYFESHFSYSLIPITSDFKTNMVPQAEPGDLIVYNWYGKKIANAEHVAMVVRLVSGHYPQVAEWGQIEGFDSVLRYLGVPVKAGYVERGWTWSQRKHEWLQEEFHEVHAWLLHINGGVYTPTF